MMIIILITSLLIVKCSWCLPLDQLYPYGLNENDQVIDSSFNFPTFFFSRFDFDSTSIQDINIRLNGIITLNATSPNSTASTDTPMPFPIKDFDVIAPYWFDSGFPLDTCNETSSFNKTIDFNTTGTSFANKTFFVNKTSTVNETSINETSCRYNGTVYYGSRYSSFLQDRATREIRAAFFNTRSNFFIAYNLFVVTWVITDNKDDLPEPKKNVFQCVLASSGQDTYVIFNYADGLSLPTDELNVQAGINAAFRPTPNFVSIPDTSNISVTSNVGIPGVWMFQINTRPFTTPFQVTINTTDEQIVGQSFTMECRIQRAESIDSTFDIIWSRQRGGEERRLRNISGSLISNYSDFHTILLRRSDAEAYYRCDVIINLNQPLNASAYFVLNNVTQPPQLIISPEKSPLRVTVGDHLPIYCTAVKGVPIPLVQWHSEGFPVYPSQSFYQQIYVVPTDSPHTTTYTCVETRYTNRGEVSELRVNVTVIVEEPCPRLQRPRRGEVTITEDGQLAFFSCNRGFTMRGSSVLKCSNGQWDSTPPTCNSISRFCRQRCNF